MKMESLISIILGSSGIILFSYFLKHGMLNQISYVILISMLSLTCLALHGFSRIKEFDLKNYRIVLDRMEEVRDDVYAKSEELNKTSLELSRLIAVNTAFQGMWGTKEITSFQKKLTRSKIEALLKVTNIPKTEIAQIFRYQDAIDKLQATEDETERKRLAKELEEMISRDVTKLNKTIDE